MDCGALSTLTQIKFEVIMIKLSDPFPSEYIHMQIFPFWSNVQ